MGAEVRLFIRRAKSLSERTMEHKTCTSLRVVENRPLGGGEQFLLTLEDPGWASGGKKWRPGQFVMIRPVSWGMELTWARPISIAHVDERGLRLMIRPAGRGTGRLALLQPGEEVFVWGPLGTYFVTEPETPTLLLAGGVGLAPFWGYLARHPKPDNLRLVLGRTIGLEAFPLEYFAALEEAGRLEVFYQKTMADLDAFIALLEKRIGEYGREATGLADGGLVLACGPGPFLKTVRKACDAVGARCQISLENRMACGIGACLGCVAKDAEGHNVQSCTRGPVFWTRDLAEEF